MSSTNCFQSDSQLRPTFIPVKQWMWSWPSCKLRWLIHVWILRWSIGVFISEHLCSSVMGGKFMIRKFHLNTARTGSKSPPADCCRRLLGKGRFISFYWGYHWNCIRPHKQRALCPWTGPSKHKAFISMDSKWFSGQRWRKRSGFIWELEEKRASIRSPRTDVSLLLPPKVLRQVVHILCSI